MLARWAQFCKDCYIISTCTPSCPRGGGGGGGVLPMWWVIHMCRGFDPLFSLWQDRARSFWGTFSHPPIAKLSFGVQKLPIFTKIDLFGRKFNFFLDLFGSNFQRPAAHPHQFSGRVHPPPGSCPATRTAWLWGVGSGWCMTVLSPEVTFHIQQRMWYYCNPTHFVNFNIRTV